MSFLAGCREGGRIFTVDLYRKVRLACAEGMSQREAARQFNISRDSVRKMLAFSVPPGYRRKAAVKRPKLDAFTGIIDAWLEGDREVHRKQRHTSKRLFERLRDVEPWSRHWSEAHGEGLYRRLHGREGARPQPAIGPRARPTVREHERRGREMFVPLAHPPGHAQADFGEGEPFRAVARGARTDGAPLATPSDNGDAAQRCLLLPGLSGGDIASMG